MFYKKNSYNIYFEKIGTGNDNILILPGWGNTRETFYNIINNLKNRFTIYIIDYPGFGNSKTINKEQTIYNYAKIIKNFIKDNNITTPTIIAHSFGGRITSILIGLYKIKINKVILFDVAGIKRKKKLKIYIKEKLYKLLKIIIKLLPNKKQEKIKQKLLQIFGSSDYNSIPNSMKKTFQNIINEDLRKYYKKIENETLIIWGENDKDTPLKDAYLLNKLIKNSGLIIYKNSSHFSYLNNIYLTNNIINEFLKEKN